MKKQCLTILISAGLLTAFPTNEALKAMKDSSYLDIQNSTLFTKTLAANNILDFSGMVYNRFDHKIIAFGGGHATAQFPTNVAEFDFSTLKWSFMINIDSIASCKNLYNAQTALFDSAGQKLGGVRYNGKIYAGSRHTYDGLEMAADSNIMISAQAQEFSGCQVDKYDSLFQGGSGLFTLDPTKKEWSLIHKAGLATSYCYSAVNPAEPDLIYLGSAGMGGFNAVNWKTGEKITKRSVSFSAGSDMSMTYCPERKSFLAFPYSSLYEYSIATNTWTKLSPLGTPPNCYSLNVVYDSLNKVFCCFYDSSFYYYSPSANTWYNLPKKRYLSRLFHHHVYDPVNNVHVMVGAGWNTYAFKFSDTPGLFPGTGGFSGVEKRVHTGSLPILSVNPNPSATSTTLFYSGFGYEPLKLTITTINGKNVFDKTITPNKGNSYIWKPASTNGNSAAGVYIARLTNGKLTKTAKIMISR
ncbi:MAG: T9SS type A sorting domain-containing protein [Fibrobacteres bacterium]|nr:T9SS type A sorting domain-containing protein [Fibrobacterota bacterium]